MFVFGKHWSLAGWWSCVYLVQRYLPGAICNLCDHAGLVCAYQKQPKICMKRGQRNCSKNVNNKRPFGTCFRLLTSPTWSHWLQIAPKLLSWSVRYRDTWVEALPHKLPPDTHWPADWLYPVDDTGLPAQLREPCTQSGARVATAGRPVGHWTRVQDSPTVASTVTRTRILLWWNIF